MFGYGMMVEDVGACVRLIDVMTRNLPALGIERRHFDAVYIETDKPAVIRRTLGEPSPEPSGRGRRRYTLLLSGIPESAIANLERLAGTKFRELSEKMPADQTISINELLESVLLVREPRASAANGLILAVLGTDPDRVDLARWHADLSRLGCRGVRIGCVATAGIDIRVLYLIEIARPPPNFVPPTEWEAKRVLVFYRLKREALCPFYIEWGYAHPVRELARLYQVSDERLVLMAADALERPRGHVGQSQTQVSLKLRPKDWLNIFEMPDQAEYAIELATELELQSLDASTQTMNVSIAVDVRGRPVIGSGVAEIEHKIAWHQHAIEQLYRTRQYSEIERHEPVYLVRVFEQYPSCIAVADEEPPDSSRALPAGFIRFLNRPYSELAGFKYGFFEDPFRPGVWLHIVMDENAGGYERLVTDMASDTYVCLQRWWDLGVRLFVRSCDTLHPHIEDEALLVQLRDELWGRGGFDHEHPMLLRRHPDTVGAAQAVYVPHLSRLLDPGVFQLLSTRLDVRVAEFHLGTRDDMLNAQHASARALGDLAGTLETGVEAAIADRLNAVEAAWKDADERMREVETRLTCHLASAAEISALLDRHGNSWIEFVKNVLKADRTLSDRKVEALGKYEALHDEHAKAIQLFERGLIDVNERLERDQQEVAERRAMLDEERDRFARLEKALPTSIAVLDNLGTQLSDNVDSLIARQRKSLDEERIKVGELTKKLSALQQAIAATDEERGRAEKQYAAHMRGMEQLRRFKSDEVSVIGKAELSPVVDEAFIELGQKGIRTEHVDGEFLKKLEEDICRKVQKPDKQKQTLFKWVAQQIRRREQ